jgi:hypothetical protein
MSGGSGGGSSGGDTWRPKAGGAGGGGGGGGGNGGDPCTIIEKTILNSPNATVVASLKSGNQLSVQLEKTPRQRVVVKDQSGQIAGAITSANLLQIIECLDGGYAYKATVLSVTGGKVEIEISPA